MSHFSHIRVFANPFPFYFKTILRFLALSVPLIATQLTAAPIISNLTASQRTGTKLVDIGYDLTATGFPTVAVSMEISSDGGATWTVPVTSVSGAIGSSVAPGTGKVIVWDAGADWPRGYSSQMRFRVTADDGFAPPIDEHAELDPGPYFVENTTLVSYPLSSGRSFSVGFRLVDSTTTALAPVNGTVVLGLVTTDFQPVAFAYTLNPATFVVTQGMVEGQVTVNSAADLTGAYLAVMSFQLAAPNAANSAKIASPGGQALLDAPAPALQRPMGLVGDNLVKSLNQYFDEKNPSSLNELVHPLPGATGNYIITGSYGEWRSTGRHQGIDLAAVKETEVRAIAKGVVSHIGDVWPNRDGKPAGGELIVINHGNGYCSRYLHIVPRVKVHDIVLAGHKIGEVADIPLKHLHFEIREGCHPYYRESQPERNGEMFQTGKLSMGLGKEVNPVAFNQKFTPRLVDVSNDTKPPSFRGLNFFANFPSPSKDYYTPAAFDGIRIIGSAVQANNAVMEGVIEVVDTEATAAAPYALVPRSLTITESLHPSGSGVRPLANFSFEREAEVRPLFPILAPESPTFPSTANGGYALPKGKTLAREDSYPLWFKWDTSAYKDVPAGPRKLTFTATDWMDRKTEYAPIFGPEFSQAVPPQSVPEESGGVTFDVKIKAHLGPYPDGMLGLAKDMLELSFRGKTDTTTESFAYDAYWKQGTAEEVKTSKLFTGANAATAEVEETLTVRVVLKSGVSPPQSIQTLVLRAKSGNFPNLAHELEVKLGPSTCDPLPIAATPPPAPAGFSLIPGGSFTMGRTSGDTDSDAPPITVTVSPFYIQQTETTKAQWDEVRNWAVNKGYTDLAAGDGKASNHPVQTVSWWDVVKWCNARSEKEGLSPCYYTGPERRADQIYRSSSAGNLTVCWGANGYRLPTEAEWEKAARGGVSGKRFPWGTDTISHAQANYYGSSSYAYDQSPINKYHPSYATGGSPYTSPVGRGSFGANGYGLYDMAGNVWEWCWDWYGSSYYTTSNGITDPRGPASGTGRVGRGGSWSDVAIDARCAFRYYNTPGGANNNNGFRPARSSVP